MDQVHVLYEKIDLRMFMINIESYGNIILYFCEIGNIKEIFDFGLYNESTDYNS